jgi:FHA domain
VLTIAYGEGLLSEDTFLHRLDQALEAGQIDAGGLVGDLMTRAPVSGLKARLLAAVDRLHLARAGELVQPADLLALDWTGAVPDLLVGRSRRCDIVLDDPGVSRRHARLVFRDGSWVLQDLQSTNGTTVNGVQVGRCQLRPGDSLTLGTACLRVD